MVFTSAIIRDRLSLGSYSRVARVFLVVFVAHQQPLIPLSRRREFCVAVRSRPCCGLPEVFWIGMRLVASAQTSFFVHGVLCR